MKSNPQATKSRSFELLKSTLNQSGKIRKTRSMTPESPQSQSTKIPTNIDVPRRSPRLSEKFQVSMETVLDCSGTKRKILTDAPVNVKRFKDSQGKSVQEFQAGLDDDLSKESTRTKENESVSVLKLRSDDRPIIMIPAAHTWRKKNNVKELDSKVKSSSDISEETAAKNDPSLAKNDSGLESDLDAVSTPSCINDSELFVSTFELSEVQGSPNFDETLNETDGIYLTDQPSFVRSSVSSEEGQASGDTETEEIDVETTSNDFETDDDLRNDQDQPGQAFEGTNEADSHQPPSFESTTDPNSSSASQVDETLQESDAIGISLEIEEEEMEQEDEDNTMCSDEGLTVTDVDMSGSMASIGQTSCNVGIIETSLDGSVLAGPWNGMENLSASSIMMPQDAERIHHYQRITKIERVVPAADGKEAVLTHESVRNYKLHLSSGDEAPEFSRPDGNMMDSLFHDEGDEELERIVVAWNETQLRLQQCNSGQNSCSSVVQDDNELYIILSIILVLFILFISKHLIEAVRSVPPF